MPPTLIADTVDGTCMIAPSKSRSATRTSSSVTPAADVVATTLLRCFTLPGPEVEPFLLANPTVMLRMLQGEARRLRVANTWRG